LTGQPVVLKTLATTIPDPKYLARYEQEYTITDALKGIPGVIQVYELSYCNHRPVIVLEDYGAQPLSEYLSQAPLDLTRFLDFALTLTDILAAVHSQQVIHKDINPANILIHPQTLEIKLIDFGISSLLSRESVSLSSLNVLEGTLAYLSPEQTGRMNRSVDYRTDFYALGATFYEMLTGQVPFAAQDVGQDVLALVHCHIARMPLAPHEIDAKIPSTVSGVVMKLLAKTAEDRYQSTWGLRGDLLKCRDQLLHTGILGSFELGGEDLSDRFQLSQKLYGREAEIAEILAAFHRVNPRQQSTHQGSSVRELLLLKGYSGIGKSTLVREAYKPVTERQGYLIAGKFDPLQRNIPYRGFIDAFSDLVNQLLTEPEAQLQDWALHLKDVFGSNLQVMVALVPNLALIVGEQSSPPRLSGMEAQNRFNLAIQSFVQVFAQPAHPLVICLDDLQWADQASLQLMQRLLTEPDSHSLLLIGVYRDNEARAGHPLAVMLEQLAHQGRAIAAITVQPLTLSDINQLVVDTLHRPPPETEPLAALVRHKTGGNPFFVSEFLKARVDDGLIYFDRDQWQWNWDLAQIKRQAVTENLVDLMTAKLKKLPAESQQALQYAACIGTPFDVRNLAQVLQQPLAQTAQSLWPALQAELLVPDAETHRLVTVAEGYQRPLQYYFAHDRVQQAAYALMPKAQRPAVHQAVGLRLLDAASQELSSSRLFHIVNQLNLGRSLTTDPANRSILAGLNLRAGRQAKAAAAYEPALDYLKTGISLLEEPAWELEPEIMGPLHYEAADVACLCGQYTVMTRLIATALARLTDISDRTQLHLIQLQAFILQNQPLQAIDAALPLLRQLGVTFPKRGRLFYTIVGLLCTRLKLMSWPEQRLLEHPDVSHPRHQAALWILTKIGTTAYVAVPDLSPLITFKVLQLSLCHGYAPTSAMSFAAYGLVTCAIVNNIKSGYYYGQIALKLADRFQQPIIRCRANFLFTYLIAHWKTPLRELVPKLEDVHRLGLQTGDLEYAAYALFVSVQVSFLAGENLAKIEHRLDTAKDIVDRLQQKTARQWIVVTKQLVHCLCHPSQPATEEHGGLDLPNIQDGGDRTAQFLMHSYQMFWHYLFGNIPEALDAALKAKPVQDSATSAPSSPFHDLIESLVRLANSPKKRRGALRQVNKTRQKFRLWAHHAPANYEAGQYLLDGEYYRVKGQIPKALRYLQKAIQAAHTYERLHEEAIAHECLGRLYLQLEQPIAASGHFTHAHLCYQRWGASAKAIQLQQQQPTLITSSNHHRTRRHLTLIPSTSGTTTNRLSTSLDVSSLMKASQAISGEIRLEHLLEQLMEILLENAGAESGVLLLDQGGQLEVAATGTVRDGDTDIQQGALVDANPPIATSIINYVARTKESVVLNNASQDQHFAQDPYIVEHQPQSVLCTPLSNQGQLRGLIYLENNLTPNAFTEKRLQVLRLLSSQAAIALDNARLYTDVANLNKAYARFVPQQLLQHLKKSSITEVNLGDNVELDMSVMFADIRSFTTLSEQLTPAESFRFINDYLARLEPVIVDHQGFIDKYIGDAIMALFSGGADDAVKGGIAMQKTLATYNQERQHSPYPPIRLGIGINTGRLMLGTVGGKDRMDGTVISDAVNLAARLESLTKRYKVDLLISHDTYTQLRYPQSHSIRKIGTTEIRGRSKAVTIYEVFDADAIEVRAAKQAIADRFDRALTCYEKQDWQGAIHLFKACLDRVSSDPVAQYYLDQCQDKPNQPSLTEKR
jgi:predicted ATPase/class 3 adenylate cyclase/tRNA A-37 threonylcarbamoyl transferase component Bud32